MAAATTVSKRSSNGPVPADKHKQPVTVPDFLSALSSQKIKGTRILLK